MRYLFLALIISLSSCSSTAQMGKNKYSTENKKAIKLFEAGNQELVLDEIFSLLLLSK